jgi:hypothetical protein
MPPLDAESWGRASGNGHGEWFGGAGGGGGGAGGVGGCLLPLSASLLIWLLLLLALKAVF